MCVQYIGGCSVHRGNTTSASGGYHEYIRVVSTSRDTMNTWGDVQYIGDTMSTLGGYHEYIRNVQYIRGIS